MSTISNLLTAGNIRGDYVALAVTYAGLLGWPVVPCRHVDMASGPAKSPYGGLRTATVDPDAIRGAWEKHSRALIGVVPPAGHVVIDIDPRAGGSLEALAELCGGSIPETLTAESGRGDGGRHYWFTTSRTDLTQRSLAPGIDSRLAGKGVVIVPPSLHPVTGRPYTWLTASAPVPYRPGLRTRSRRTGHPYDGDTGHAVPGPIWGSLIRSW